MANVTNKAYYGKSGTLVLDGDTHFGVTSFMLTPSHQEEQVVDISGDVQSTQSKPTWRAGVEFHQDHITDGSLSKKSRDKDGDVIPFTYTPDEGGDTATGNIRMKASVFGGGTGRHSGTLDLAVIGQPEFTPAA